MGEEHIALDSFYRIYDYNLFFPFASEAFSAVSLLLSAFETLVRLSWLEKTSNFRSMKGANLSLTMPLCVIALCLWGMGYFTVTASS